MLERCVRQSGEEISPGVFDVMNVNDIEPITYDQFKSQAMSAQIGSDDVKAVEDMFWKQITKERIYSVDNQLTLFGMNVDTWNLDKFTKDQSSIHSKPSHRLLEVSY